MSGVRRLVPFALLIAAFLFVLATQAEGHHPAKQLRAQQLKAGSMERLSRRAERWPRVRHWRSVRVAVKRQRVRALRAHRTQGRLYPPGPAVLNRIAACESGGNPRAVSPGGAYRGKYQFDYRTWGSVGGSGDPAAASEAEQDYRAARLYRSRGPQPWPICGYR